MLETDIHKLNERPGRSLDHLEADVWAGVAARAKTTSLSRVVFAAQTVVLAVALIGSVAAGNWAAVKEPPSELGVFSTRAELAPTTRLLGDTR